MRTLHNPTGVVPKGLRPKTKKHAAKQGPEAEVWDGARTVYLPIFLSVYPPVCLSGQPVSLPVCPSACLAVCQQLSGSSSCTLRELFTRQPAGYRQPGRRSARQTASQQLSSQHASSQQPGSSSCTIAPSILRPCDQKARLKPALVTKRLD